MSRGGINADLRTHKFSISLADLAARLDAEVIGDGAIRLNGVAPLDCADIDQLTFLANPQYLPQVQASNAGAVIISAADLKKLDLQAERTWLVARNPYACFARAAQLFATEVRSARTPGRAANAYIDPRAQVPDSCYIGPFVSIEAGAVLGERVQLVGHIHIGAHVRIEEDTLIYANVSIYEECEIGARCIIHSGAVIGADGFGFAPDFNAAGGEWVKIPQTGKVVLGHDVEIGANTTIDRGAMAGKNTVIGQGCKIDNQVQIAHNVQVGAYTVIAGNTAIAGSVKIGKYCIIGGSANIAGHLTITDRVTISGATGITKSITSPGHFTAVFPFMPHRDWEKNAAVLRQLNKWRARVRQLESAFLNKK